MSQQGEDVGETPWNPAGGFLVDEAPALREVTLLLHSLITVFRRNNRKHIETALPTEWGKKINKAEFINWWRK